MKTSLRIILRSWQLPWQEKRLLSMPVLFVVALFIAQIFGNGMGLKRYTYDLYQVNPGAPLAEIELDFNQRESFLFQVYRGLTAGFLAIFSRVQPLPLPSVRSMLDTWFWNPVSPQPSSV